MLSQELQNTIKVLSQHGKGILAADESNGTIAKRFASIALESTEENRRAYRELLFTAPQLNLSISGVILFDETIRQSTLSGQPFPDLLKSLGIIPGIKVDKGLIPLTGTNNESITEGLDGLAQRLIEYKAIGAQFAKWRTVFSITDNHPSDLACAANAETLARYASVCQSLGIVPIVEPEVLMEGDHSIERCALVTTEVLQTVFQALARHHVNLEHIVLKPSMVISGSSARSQASVAQVAHETVNVLRHTVPAAVPTINFLSGGQGPLEATAHLNAINLLGTQPWNLSFSYGRALQEPCLKTWLGKPENVAAAQKILIHRAVCIAQASLGKYTHEN